MRSRSPRLVLSPWIAAASPPITATASCSCDWRRPVINTRAPSCAKRFAIPRPMPALPPVTRAILAASLPVILGSLFHRDLLHCPRRHIREERAESLSHSRMRNDGIAKSRIWETRQHCSLHHSHDLSGLGADHREAEKAVVTPNKGLHEPLCFVSRLRPQHSAHR